QFILGRLEALSARKEMLPRIASSPLAEIAEVKVGRIKRALDFTPSERSRHRRMRLSPHGVRTDDGLHGTVAKRVEIHSLSTRGDRMFGRKKPGMGCRQQGNRRLGELQNVVCSRTDANRNKYMKPAAA